jgi:hypothetical protein
MGYYSSAALNKSKIISYTEGLKEGAIVGTLE